MIPYAHIVQTVYLRPWAIVDTVHAQIRGIVRTHVEKGHISAEDIQERLAASPRRVQTQSPVGVAIIPIQGVIMPKANLMAEMSGGTSVERLRGQFRSAMADADVDGIVFDVDSPGGLVDGIPELAAEIRAARGVKPMISVSNTTNASAAYWLSCQADELLVTPSGAAGSIGVFSSHEDWSEWWAQMGVKTTLISAGKFKTEGNEFEPLSDEAKAHFQQEVDDFYGMFTRDVAAARGVSPAAVRDGFGQGRMLTSKRAVTEGIADRVGTLEDAVVKVARDGAKRRDQRAAEGPGYVVQAVAAGNPIMSAGVIDDPVEDQEEIEEPAAASGPPTDFYAIRKRIRDRQAS